MKNVEFEKKFFYEFEQLCNITLVLCVFLRCHFEASLHHIYFLLLLIIHVDVKLPRICNVFHTCDINKKVTIFALEPLCVASNVFLTWQN